MGDSGSYFLGYLLATASLTGAMQKTSTAVSLLVPMVALGVPIFDTLFSMLRRTLERRSVFSPDRGHVHHRLLDMGITHRRAVILLYGVSILLMVSAIAIALGRSWESGAALLVASVVITALIRFVGYFEYVRLERGARSQALDTRTRLLRRELPELVTQLAQPIGDEQIWERLTAFSRACECAQLVLVAHAGAPTRRAPEDVEIDARELAWARFELGDGGGHVSCGFAPSGALSARADILLQLAADAVGRALALCARRASPSRRIGVAVTSEADEPGPSPSDLPRRRAISG
jgi:UDP-GlcNAc:undecaprenyl-phosphate GlcNAc-1-phosphate transferase